MERSEPALVPEWLRSAGSVTGGGSLNHHSASSSSNSDVSSLVNQARNRNSRSRSDGSSPRSSFLDRSSSNSRRSSSNGSAKHAYSSFSRSHRDRDRDREKEKLSYLDPWDQDSSDPLGSILTSREKDGLRHSFSMTSRKQSDMLPRRDLKNDGNSNIRNGILSGPTVGNTIKKTVFEKDFPSLGSEDRQVGTDISRVSSPGLTSAAQSLPVGNSALIGGESWISALADVPNAIGSTSIGSLSSPQTSTAHTGSGPSSTNSGLNMAEALAQAPLRARTLPQVSVKTQRLEELAIKQSRQLIPVTPSMPKGLVLGSDKSKTKTAARTGEMSQSTSRGGSQQLSTFSHSSQPLPGGQMKSDASKTSHGKLCILKPSWENGVYPSPKDSGSPNNNANGRAPSNQLAVPPSAAAAPPKTSNSPRERKAMSFNMMPGLTLEKKPSLSQAQSRHDFFKFLKQKTSVNMSTDVPVSGPCDSLSAAEKPEAPKEVACAPVSPHAVMNGVEVTDNGNVGEGVQGLSHANENNLSVEAAGYPDEEEAAFLRSLGWEENSGEDEGLTEEEINSFYQQYIKLKPSLKACRGFLPKLSEVQETPLGDEGVSSGSSSSSSESDA